MNRRALLAFPVLVMSACEPAERADDMSSAPDSTSLAVNQAQDVVVRYPGQFATLQAAVDATPDGGKLKLSAGTYYEGFSVYGKRIEIVGAGTNATVLDGANVPGALVSVGNLADVTLRKLTLTTPEDAVASDTPNGGDATAITANEVAFVDVARAVKGRFKVVVLKKSSIVGAKVAGVVLRDTPRSAFREVVIDATDPGCKSGLFVDNTGNGNATVTIEDTSIDGGAEGGVVVLGGKKVDATSVFISDSRVVGMGLFEVKKAKLTHVQVSRTRADAAGRYGDGIFLWATDASLVSTVSTWNDRSGLFAAGCDTTAQTSRVTIADSQLACSPIPFSVAYNTLSGLACGSTSITTLDAGGNACSAADGGLCGGATCHAISKDLEPISVPSPP